MKQDLKNNDSETGEEQERSSETRDKRKEQESVKHLNYTKRDTNDIVDTKNDMIVPEDTWKRVSKKRKAK